MDAERQRRRRSKRSTSGATVLGDAGAAYTQLRSLSPSALAVVQGGPFSIDLGVPVLGDSLSRDWSQLRIWLQLRTADIIQTLARSELIGLPSDPELSSRVQQSTYAQNPVRSIRPDSSGENGQCLHLVCILNGCAEISDTNRGDWLGGYPCHSYLFDYAGCEYMIVLATSNLLIPSHEFLSSIMLQIELDYENTAHGFSILNPQEENDRCD